MATGTIDLEALLSLPTVTAIISTLDETGAPHAVPSPFLKLDERGFFVHLELLETSASHRNLVRSIWFERPVGVTLTTGDGQVAVIRGRAHKAHVSGPYFSEQYRNLRDRLGDVDLAAVWLIEPQLVSDETYQTRKAREEELHPFHLHLDRLAVKHS
jgi:hypothetical protein